MNTQSDYDRLQAELAAIEKATGCYLADENVDRENVGDSGGDFWREMCDAASMAAGMRAQDAGLDINALIGRDIY